MLSRNMILKLMLIVLLVFSDCSIAIHFLNNVIIKITVDSVDLFIGAVELTFNYTFLSSGRVSSYLVGILIDVRNIIKTMNFLNFTVFESAHLICCLLFSYYVISAQRIIGILWLPYNLGLLFNM